MRADIRKLFASAYGLYGIGAFNAFHAEQILALFRGARRARAPLLIQFTPAARNYLPPAMLSAMVSSLEEIFPEVVFAVHLDHGTREHCLDGIQSKSYSSVMIDASAQPFEENVRQTREVVERAHDRGVAVEAELGVLSGVEDHSRREEEHARYTDPDQAAEFVSRTGCDSLAVAVGTSHGAYKFSGGAGLRLDILAEIQRRLPGFPLVLHGASAVSAGEVARINRSGGRIGPEARGVTGEELLSAIRLGVCKINIATDMRLLWARVHREFFLRSPEQFDLTVPGKEYVQALEELTAYKCASLQSENRAKEL